MKKILSIIVLSFVLFIVACGEQKTDQEVVVDAFNALTEVETFETTSIVDINVSMENMDPFVGPYIEMINNLEIALDMKSDLKAEKNESIIKVKGEMAPFAFDVEIPFLQDLKTNKMYVKTDSLVENFAMFFPIPESLKGKLVEIDLAEYAEMNEAADYAKMNTKVQEVFNSFMSNKSEADFTKEGDVYTVTFNEEEVKTFLKDLMAAADDTLTEQELAEMEDGLNQMFEEAELNKFEVKSTIKKGELKDQTILLSFAVNDEMTGNVSVDLTLTNTYTNIGEPVNFTVDPSNEEIVNIEEIEAMMMEMY